MKIGKLQNRQIFVLIVVITEEQFYPIVPKAVIEKLQGFFNNQQAKIGQRCKKNNKKRRKFF